MLFHLKGFRARIKKLFEFSCLESVELLIDKDLERNPHSLSSAQSDWIWLELEWAKEEYFFVPLF
jgi:hypothetical protein